MNQNPDQRTHFNVMLMAQCSVRFISNLLLSMAMISGYIFIIVNGNLWLHVNQALKAWATVGNHGHGRFHCQEAVLLHLVQGGPSLLQHKGWES